MIEARKSRWFDAVFFRYNLHYLLKRHFHSIGLSGTLDPQWNAPLSPGCAALSQAPRMAAAAEALRRGEKSLHEGSLHEGRAASGRSSSTVAAASTSSQGVLYVMNHSSWWDGLIVYHAFRMVSTGDHYVMMDERQLTNYRFFSRLGAFSIDKTTLRGMAVSLDYAVRLLHEGKRVWMFPQGDIFHLEHRPLEVKGGAAYLLQRAPQCAVVPVSAYYSLCQHQKAEVTLVAGQPLAEPWRELGKERTTALIAERLRSQLEQHREMVVYRPERLAGVFMPLLSGSGSVSERFDNWRRWRQSVTGDSATVKKEE